MRISDWSSDVCSSDLFFVARSADIDVNTAMMRSFLATLTLSVFGSALVDNARAARTMLALTGALLLALPVLRLACGGPTWAEMFAPAQLVVPAIDTALTLSGLIRQEEYTSELQSLKRLPYA